MPDNDVQPTAVPNLDPATEVEDIMPPEQVPMDDAAGGPTVDSGDDTFDADTAGTNTDDLSVQGGE